MENYCIDNSYCNPPYTTCNIESNLCVHKDLFPLTLREIIGVFVLIIFAGIATISGRSGGPMIIPVLKGFFMLDMRNTLALSNGLIIINSLGKYIMTFNKKDTDPRYTHMPMINYGLSIICAPMMLLGNWLGFFANQILPKPILLILVILVLSISFKIAYAKYLEEYEKEKSQENKSLEENLIDQENRKKLKELPQIDITHINTLNLESYQSPMHKIDHNALQIIARASMMKKS